MALQLKVTVCIDCKNRRIIVTNATGTYNATTNPGGFGSPNPATAALTGAYIIVESETIGQKVFDVLSAFSDLTAGYSIWMNSDTLPSLDLGEDAEVPSELITITLQVSGTDQSSVAYTDEATIEALGLCSVQCCAAKLAARSNCTCHGGNAVGTDASLLLKGIEYAWNCGKRQLALDNFEALKQLCSSECKDCGCH